MLERLALRTRLVAGTALLVLLGLTVAGFVATSSLRSYQLERVDEQLEQAAASPFLRDVAGGVATGLGPGGRGRDGHRGGPPPRLPGELYRALLDTDGAVVAASQTPSPDVPEVPEVTAEEARELAGRPFTVDSAVGDGQWRVVAVPLAPGGSGSTLLLAADLGEVDATVARLAALQLVVGALVLAGTTGLGLVLVRSSLRGLVEVEQAASSVAAGRLDSRVPERHPSTEVGRLGRAFNRMVAHVQEALAAREASEQRLRRFVADAGHELRTPLTSIRGFAELHRQGAVTEPDDVARAMRRIEDEATRMSRLVDDLLTLARLDEQRPLELADVDLSVLATDAVHDARAIQPQRPVSLDLAGSVIVRGDEARLRQVLGNLLSNALQHTPARAPIEVRVRSSDDEVVVEVADSGPGMAPEVADRVFERFYRADSSRARESGGSGLGLSIVASLARAHGGRAELDTAPGRGAVFRVVLPRD
jgi:two-component system, OmpR family, sensor kinase